MIKKLFLFLFFLIALSSNESVASQSTAPSQKNSKPPTKTLHWNVSITSQSGQKICYITSSPVNSTSTCGKPRNSPFSTVTYISKALDEVSVSSGFEHKGPVVAIIDGKHKKVLSVIDGKVAWTQNIDIDKELIALMKRGNSMVIESSSECGIIRDKYSLAGFTKAYENMRYMCSSNTNSSYS